MNDKTIESKIGDIIYELNVDPDEAGEIAETIISQVRQHDKQLVIDAIRGLHHEDIYDECNFTYNHALDEAVTKVKEALSNE